MKTRKMLDSFDELWSLLFGDRHDDQAGAESSPAESPQAPQPDSGQPAVEPGASVDAAATIADAPAEPAASDAAQAEPEPVEQTEEATEPPGPPPLDGKARKRLAVIQKFAAWGGEDGVRELNAALALFHEQYPGNESVAKEAVNMGRANGKMFKEAFKIGGRGESEQAINDFIDRLPSSQPAFIAEEILRQYNCGKNAFKRHRAEWQRKKAGKTLSNVRPPEAKRSTTLPKQEIHHRHHASESMPSDLHPNDVRTLAPAASWNLIIDETGVVFDETAQGSSDKRIGRFVGIVVPTDRPVLDPLPSGWHAVDIPDPAEIDAVVQKLLNAPVGVFGIDVRSLPVTAGERWLDGVALLIDWVLRLMPVVERCALNVLVEQRGVFKGGQTWDLVRRDALRRLALAYPKRAARINLEIRTIAKTDQNLDGYADAVAYTWAQTSDTSKARLRQSGLLGTCLLDSAGGADARAMLHAWDAFAQGVHLPPALWWDLVISPDIRNPAAILSAFLHLVGQEAQKENEPKLWGQLLGEVKSRMAATPVDLRRLAAAVDWLQRYQPDNAVILPALRMVWLTVQLARANHLGEIEHKWQTELESLGNRLFDEAAPLVCHADLHLAVSATNRFDFENAGQSLARWRDVPPAVPGLQYWGQIQSSFGQHAAFLGDNTRAIPLFREAMAAFERLSDPQSKQRDRLQTGAYLAIAMMDDPATDAREVRHAVEFVIGNLPDAAVRLAASDNPNDRYAHHLLLRGLIQRDDPAVAQKYIEQRESWQTGEGHPWPLIQLYRGILLRETDPEAAVKLALDGADRAFSAQQGPTVNVIGACCRAVATAWGTPWPEGEKELARLKSKLPAAADRIDRLARALQAPGDPLTLLQGVLPFNFR